MPEYEKRPVEQDKIDKILEAGISAPTACNNQPRRVLIIDNDEDRRECRIRPMDGKARGDIDASIAATHMMPEATE